MHSRYYSFFLFSKELNLDQKPLFVSSQTYFLTTCTVTSPVPQISRFRKDHIQHHFFLEFCLIICKLIKISFSFCTSCVMFKVLYVNALPRRKQLCIENPLCSNLPFSFFRCTIWLIYRPMTVTLRIPRGLTTVSTQAWHPWRIIQVAAIYIISMT